MPPKRQKAGAALHQNLHLFEDRLATFKSSYNPHRRTSTVSNKQVLTWPIPDLSIEKLALAGFYYRPTIASQDNCVCYLCDKALDGWEEGDSPAEEHLRHAPYCGWAIIHSMMVDRKKGRKVKLEDPNGDFMTNARRMTFGNWWPHEGKRGWVPTVDAMVAAGFHYIPSAEWPDKAGCAYCDLELDGWDQNDNPWNEHQRRNPNCTFFTWVEGATANQRPVIPGTEELAKNLEATLAKPRKRAPAAPKVGRKRTNSNASTMSTAGGSRKKKEELAATDSAPDTQEEAPVKRKREKAPPRTGRKRAGSNASLMSEMDHRGRHHEEEQQEPEPGPVPEKPRKRAPAATKTGRRRAGSNASVMHENERQQRHDDPMEQDDPPPEPKPRKRAPAASKRPRRAGSVLSLVDKEEQRPQFQIPESPPPAPVEQEPEAEKKARKRAPAAAKPRKRGGSVLSLVDTEEQRPQFQVPESPPPGPAPEQEAEEEERKPRKRMTTAPKQTRKRGASKTRTGGPAYVKPELATFGDKRTDEERSQQSSKTESFLSQFIRPASKTPVLSRESSREVSPARSEVGASGMRMFGNFSESFVEEAPPPRTQIMKKVRTAPELKAPAREPTPKAVHEPELEPVKPKKRTKETAKSAPKRSRKEDQEEETAAEVPLPKNFTLLPSRSAKSLRRAATPESEHELRPLRQDSDGGMVLFDGGHDTDTEIEDEPEPTKKERTSSIHSDGSLGKRKRAEELNHRDVELEEASEPKKHKTKAKKTSRKEPELAVRKSREGRDNMDYEMEDSGVQDDGYDEAMRVEQPRARDSRSALNSEKARPKKEKSPAPVPTTAEPEPEVDHDMTDAEPPKPEPKARSSKSSLLSSKYKQRKAKSPTPVRHKSPTPQLSSEIAPISASSPKRMSIDRPGSITPRPASPMGEDEEDLPSFDEADLLAQQQLIHEASTAGLTPSPSRRQDRLSPQQTPRRSFHREGSVVVHPDSLPLHRSSSSPLKQENSPTPRQSLRHVTSSPMVNAPVLAPPNRAPSTPPFRTPEAERHYTPTPTSNPIQTTPPHAQHPSLATPQHEQLQLPWSLIDPDSFLDEVEDSTDIANFDLSNMNTSNVDALLSAEERDLTVQEWVKRNAVLAEKRLLEVCERMVGVFEKEGRRALESLERGVEVSS